MEDDAIRRRWQIPVNEAFIDEIERSQARIGYEIEAESLGVYLSHGQWSGTLVHPAPRTLGRPMHRKEIRFEHDRVRDPVAAIRSWVRTHLLEHERVLLRERAIAAYVSPTRPDDAPLWSLRAHPVVASALRARGIVASAGQALGRRNESVPWSSGIPTRMHIAASGRTDPLPLMKVPVMRGDKVLMGDVSLRLESPGRPAGRIEAGEPSRDAISILLPGTLPETVRSRYAGEPLRSLLAHPHLDGVALDCQIAAVVNTDDGIRIDLETRWTWLAEPPTGVDTTWRRFP